ncbi:MULTISPECIES: xanthine dehydrogenase family protein subunit M [unclassified Mesorhizobium]|uniref:FAD binding domain-containing protein n=1 Tax=unclassified Mesorhizobium TaxID=325217 RepID=UPI000FD779B4|nr:MULTISPECIES: xanthine dehydrogenase family protein subunit M [unclassified Mesorhizobium]TGR23077.1 xanthine dehydrogenase family protein subunit M [Mesorhizobium sp. M8A.F.Ca.ET.197.01.1.1]TGR39163.1 xanthine dehydrogenase family protein subunit M [bacterium M00.F.Ca.ET.199.01.1.1]TGR46757.1 xanthine dehydrogenase family protein subunit M [Mesorhizobium sp. M8A.F.Ca.ET.198.01.1.1]TGV85168.1 xanthine dehydrogenase family protein subunit M [Mesorhizobium sp. M00.F.Ca.ET.149.01.1.1]
MRSFEYVRAADAASGSEAVSAHPSAKFLAGGTNLIDLMKEDIERPSRIVDINRLPLRQIERTRSGLSIGALTTNTETANHLIIRENYPLLTQAIVAGASGQLRNMATNGGNLLQRTRCNYFYDTALPCNKRQPGSGCAARHGLNRIHAIFGWSDSCVATYPGDMANALYALGASVRVRNADGRERIIPVNDFHRLPGDAPQRDTNLEHGELIVAIELPTSAQRFARNSHYLKVRDRASYAFAMVAVAAALEIERGTIRRARVFLGGVAHRPWRSAEAEELLAGRRASEDTFRQAGIAALRDAQPLQHNGFKIELGQRSVERALMRAAQLA